MAKKKSAFAKQLDQRDVRYGRPVQASVNLKDFIAKREERDAGWDDVLAKSARKPVTPPKTPSEISLDLLTAYSKPAIRPMTTFSRSFKTSDEGKIRLAVASHLWGIYKVPSFLQDSWLLDIQPQRPANDQGPFDNNWRRNGIANRGPRIDEREINLRRNWYICAASGGSLYKECTKELNGHPFMTKKETHAFLTCPIKATFREALIYALATSYTNELAVKTRVMKSKLTDTLSLIPAMNVFYAKPIWREVIHFFCSNELMISDINDFVDYFIAMIARHRDYTLKGRTVHTLRRGMQDWHWELARVKRMGNAEWEGLPITDESIVLEEDKDVTWSFKQLKSSKALAAEGTAMHHCVYSYQSKCVAAQCSIWSVTKTVNKKGWSIDPTRCLTIETNEFGDLVQIRGYANRSPTNEEMRAVRRWASNNMLKIRQFYY